jgi:hypothetical protein
MKRFALALLLLSVAADARAQGNRPVINNTQNAPPITVSPPITTSPTITTSPNINTSPAAQSRSNAMGGTSGSTSSANPAATSGSSAVSIQTGNSITNIPNDTTVRSAPLLYVPSVSTGNVCALGTSAGASWIAAAFAIGISWESMQCERRQTAALLWNMGTPEAKAAAKEILCNSPEIRAAYKTIGSPCAADMMRVEGPAAPQQMPAPQAIQPRVAAFDATRYGKASDCLTAAQAQGAPLSLCAGKQ